MQFKLWMFLVMFFCVGLSLVNAGTYDDCTIYGNCQPVKSGTTTIINGNGTNFTNYWTTDTSQTGLTGNKAGSFNLITSGNINSSNITANYFKGNGSLLTGISTFNSTYDSFYNTNNTIVRQGNFNCSSGTIQNITINSSGAFGQCVASSSGMNYTNIALTNQSNTFQEIQTFNSTRLGSSINIVPKNLFNFDSLADLINSAGNIVIAPSYGYNETTKQIYAYTQEIFQLTIFKVNPLEDPPSTYYNSFANLGIGYSEKGFSYPPSYFSVENLKRATGTVSTPIGTSKQVLGVDTLFLTEVQVGDTLRIEGMGDKIVSSIKNDTSLNVSVVYTSSQRNKVNRPYAILNSVNRNAFEVKTNSHIPAQVGINLDYYTFEETGTRPTAQLHIAGGTATAETAPIKLTAGTSMTTAEAGAIEYDGTNLYLTNTTAVRKTIITNDSSNVNLNIGNINSIGNATINNYYGSMYNFSDAGWNIGIASSGVYYNLTVSTSGELNGFRIWQTGATGTKLQALVSGYYSIDGILSGEFTGGEYGVGLVTNGANPEVIGRCYSRINLNAETSVPITCMKRLNAGDNITMVIDDEGTPTKDVTVHNINIKALRIGN